MGTNSIFSNVKLPGSTGMNGLVKKNVDFRGFNMKYKQLKRIK